MQAEPTAKQQMQPSSPDRLFLLYHELRKGGSVYSYVVGTDAFERHLALFTRLRQSANAALLPEITFDDGHLSNLELAAPALQSHGLIARFFITAGWTGVKPGYMGWPELRQLQQSGQQIGAHGWSHTLLTHCSATDLHQELAVARLTLEDKLGVPITTMSLPGGRYNRRVLAACAEAGYTQVYSSIPKSSPSNTPESLLGRLNIRGDMRDEWIASLFEPDSRVLANLERQDRIKSAAKTLLGDTLYAKLWALLNRKEQDTE